MPSIRADMESRCSRYFTTVPEFRAYLLTESDPPKRPAAAADPNPSARIAALLAEHPQNICLRAFDPEYVHASERHPTIILIFLHGQYCPVLLYRYYGSLEGPQLKADFLKVRRPFLCDTHCLSRYY